VAADVSQCAGVGGVGCRLAATMLLTGFRPRTTRYFLVSTRKYPKKLAPNSAPANFAGSLAPRLPQRVLRRHIPVPASNAGVPTRPLRACISAARAARLE
jgi:hypothetical protein